MFVLCFQFFANSITVGVVLGFVKLGWDEQGGTVWDRWDSMGQSILSRWFAFIFQGLRGCR